MNLREKGNAVDFTAEIQSEIHKVKVTREAVFVSAIFIENVDKIVTKMTSKITIKLSICTHLELQWNT